MILRVCLLLIVLFAGPEAVAVGCDSSRIRVAAASDLRFVLDRIVREYKSSVANDACIDVTYGASGVLASQIKHGAPFDLFMSADESLVIGLNASGVLQDAGDRYARGRLVLWARNGSRVDPSEGINGLNAHSRRSKLRIVIANPRHAPYGQRAKEVLQSVGLWEINSVEVVTADNVAQAAHFARTTSVDAGLIALSLARAEGMQGHGSYSVIPEEMHSPLHQRMAIVRGANPSTSRFYRYLLSEPTKRTLMGAGLHQVEVDHGG